MEQTALPLTSRSQPPPPSTLAPPPLETAATGTRALQRFDIGRMRVVEKAPPAAAEEEEQEKAVSSEAVPSEVIPRTAPWPRFEMPAARGAIPRSQRWWPIPAPVPTASAPRPLAIVRDAVWAFAAAASLAVAGSVASALVYAIAFPH